MVEYNGNYYNAIEAGKMVILVPLEPHSYYMALGWFRNIYKKILHYDKRVRIKKVMSEK